MTEHARNETPRAELVALLHAARQQPEDDAPRLIVADWLEEHGDEVDLARAEFLRLQVQVGLPPKTGGRPEALLTRHRAAWLGPFANLGDAVSFENGMIALKVPVSRLIGRASARLTQGEAMHWLEKVDLEGASDEAVIQFVASPLLPQTGSLVIGNAHLGLAAARALMRSEATSGLVALDLHGNRLSNLGASAVVGSPDLAGLRALDLSNNQIGLAGARAIAETHHTLQLRHLNLAGNNIKAEGLAVIVGSRVVANVETLLLGNTNLQAAGAERLAQAPTATKVRTLNLMSNYIGDAGVIFLARSPHLAALENLDLRYNHITDAGAKVLLESSCLPRLTNVDLGSNRLSDVMTAAVEARFGTTKSM